MEAAVGKASAGKLWSSKQPTADKMSDPLCTLQNSNRHRQQHHFNSITETIPNTDVTSFGSVIFLLSFGTNQSGLTQQGYFTLSCNCRVKIEKLLFSCQFPDLRWFDCVWWDSLISWITVQSAYKVWILNLELEEMHQTVCASVSVFRKSNKSALKIRTCIQQYVTGIWPSELQLCLVLIPKLFNSLKNRHFHCKRLQDTFSDWWFFFSSSKVSV